MASALPKSNLADAHTRLIRFYNERRLAVAALDEGSSLFEMVEGSDTFNNRGPIYRPIAIKTADQIRMHVKHLMYYVWHFGEYIKQLAIETNGLSEDQAQKLINNHIKLHRSIQIVAYLANEHKHAALSRKQWADDIEPRYGAVMVLWPDGCGTYSGVMGDELPTDIQATAGHGPAIQSVEVYNNKGVMVGHARWLADEAAAAWIKLVEKLGFSI